MPDENVQRFLDAERSATELVGQLEALKREVESYNTARESMDAVSKTLANHAMRLGELTTQTKSVVEACRTVGVPEIMGSVTASKNAVMTTLGQVRTDIENGSARQQEASTNLVSRVKRVEIALYVMAGIIVVGVVISMALIRS